MNAVAAGTLTTMAADAPPTDPARLLSGFESLGSYCDFAFVRRHFKCPSPPGLLTWAGIPYEKLIRALDAGFEGVGDPTLTRPVWAQGEYKIDTPYFRAHSGNRDHADLDALAATMEASCARLRLLRRTLLRDIAEARKIFVFRTEGARMTTARMLGLQSALHRIGPAVLLSVTVASPGEPPGEVERVAAELYHARLSRFDQGGGPYDEWLAVCRRTMALHYPAGFPAP